MEETMSNSGTVSLDGGLKVFVQGFANAGFNQTVTITPPSSQGSAAVFSRTRGRKCPTATDDARISDSGVCRRMAFLYYPW